MRNLGWNPANNGIKRPSTGAGFLPSTVWNSEQCPYASEEPLPSPTYIFWRNIPVSTGRFFPLGAKYQIGPRVCIFFPYISLNLGKKHGFLDVFWCWKWRWWLALGIFKRETNDGLPTCTTPEGPALACSAPPRAVFQSYFLVVGTYLPKINYKNFDTLPRPSRVHHVAAEIHFFPAQKQHRWSRGLSIANAYQGNLRAALAAEDQLMEHTLVLQDLNDVLKSRALEGGWFVVVVVVVVLNLMWLI